MHMAEAYETMHDRAKKRDDLARTVCDCMEEAATNLVIEDANAMEFPDGSIYLPDDDCSFEDRDGAEDYILTARAEAESDMRDANATADYMLGRTGK